MSVEYDSANTKCPFYKTETKNTIKCEGALSPTCNQNFPTSLQKKKHKARFCNKDYSGCIHFQQVDRKYSLKKAAR